MTDHGLTYNDFVKKIQSLSKNGCWNLDNKEQALPKLDNFICLNDQFYVLTHYPAFEMSFLSQNITDILGVKKDTLTIKTFFGLIHPEDLPIVLLAIIKIIDNINDHYEKIKPFESVFSIDFRLKQSNNTYNRFLNQNCVISKDEDCFRFIMLSLYTDITHFKTSKKIEFNHKYKGNGISIDFPDEELNKLVTCFSNRQLEILTLLAAGKNSREIGNILNISRHTVDTHRRKMLAQSHLCNTAELVAYSIENEMILP